MNITADPTTAGGLGTLRFDDEGVPAERAADRRGRLAQRLPHLTRDGGADRRRQRRLDARGRLEPHAARAHDEPSPRARRGHARRAARRRQTTASTWRRTAAGRSTTSGSTSSSARRSRGRSRAASSGACCATRRTRASRRSSGARSTRSPDATSGACTADELRQGPAWPAARTSRTAPRRHASATCRSEFGRERARAGRTPRSRVVEGDEAEAVAHVEHSGLARFAGSEVHQPTLIENAMVTLRVVQRQSRRRRDNEQDRRGRARRGRRTRPRRCSERTARRRLPGPGAARGPAEGRRLRRGDGARSAPTTRPGSRTPRSTPAATFRSTASSRAAMTELAVASTTGLSRPADA